MITLTPCRHTLTREECTTALAESDLTLRISSTALDVFAQINAQLNTSAFTCPQCQIRATQITSQGERFPLSTALFSKGEIEPFEAVLNGNAPCTIHFKRVDLINIENEGRDAVDEGETYRHLVTIANDFKLLTSALGPVLGRLLHTLPISWKTNVYIKGIKKSRERGLPMCDWVLFDQAGKTIGNFSLTKIEPEHFQLDEELAALNLYNVGVMLHSDFQRRGVVTAITNHLFHYLGRMKTDIDGLWIKTRPNNAGVNHIAERLNFTLLKTMDIPMEGILPCFKSNSMAFNLYVKRILPEK